MRCSVPVLILIAAGLLRGQTFDAASVKPTAPPDKNGMVSMGTDGGPGTNDPGRIQYRYLTIKTLLMNAYSVKDYQIAGPEWMNTERFDIVAKVAPGTTQAQCFAMLRNLLTERFHITLHRETRELPVYSLAVAKGGLKIQVSSAKAPAEGDAQAEDFSRRRKIGPDEYVAIEEVPAWAPIGVTGYPGRAHMSGRWKTMEELADWLARNTQRPVLDATGLTGRYDFALTYAPDALAAQSAAGDAEPLPDLVSAVAELGLKLEAKKAPMETIVIDHIEKSPADN